MLKVRTDVSHMVTALDPDREVVTIVHSFLPNRSRRREYGTVFRLSDIKVRTHRLQRARRAASFSVRGFPRSRPPDFLLGSAASALLRWFRFSVAAPTLR